MAGSRAASAREPGQIREEAALSDTARAPRISLAGAEDLRARPRTSFKGGCTVRFLVMAQTTNLEIAGLAMDRWNAGDLNGVLDLYAEDASMHPAPDWPEQTSWHGRDGIRQNMEQWRSVWDGKIASHEWFNDRRLAVAAARDA
jgi:SnoaL-like domain